MEFDITLIRRGNFIINKQEMKKYFSEIEDLFISFNSPVEGKWFKYRGSIFSLHYSEYTDSFKIFFTDKKEGFDLITIEQFKNEMIPYILNILRNDSNRKSNINFHICEKNKKLSILRG